MNPTAMAGASIEEAVQINMKLMEFKVTQTTVVILLEEQPTSKLVIATKESVEQMTQELATLTVSYAKVHT